MGDAGWYLGPVLVRTPGDLASPRPSSWPARPCPPSRLTLGRSTYVRGPCCRSGTRDLDERAPAIRPVRTFPQPERMAHAHSSKTRASRRRLAAWVSAQGTHSAPTRTADGEPLHEGGLFVLIAGRSSRMCH